MKIFISIILFVFVSVIPIYAQQFSVEQYTVEDGLSNSHIMDIYQDKMGFLWLATNGGGINIFNGKTFSNFTTDDGLISNYIFSVSNFNNKTIIVGTDKGVCFYDGINFYSSPIFDSLNTLQIFDIVVDKLNNVWIGTSKGVYKYNNKVLRKISIAKNIDNALIYRIIKDKRGNMWFGTMREGIVKYNVKNTEIYTTQNGLGNNNIRTIAEDSSGTIWIGTDVGLYKYENNEISHFVYKKNPIMSCLITSNDDLWISPYRGNKMLRINKKTNGLNILQSVKRNKSIRISTSFEDKEGNIWFGTKTGGIYKFKHTPFIHYSNKDSLPKNDVKTLCYIGNKTYLAGTIGGGVSKIKLQNRNKIKVNSLIDKSYQHSLISKTVTSIATDKNKNIWAGTYSGLSKICGDKITNYTTVNSKKENAIKSKGLSVSNITYILPDSKNNIWIGTLNNGISVFENDSIYNFNEKFPELKSKGIMSIYEDNKLNIWFLTNTGGYKLTEDSLIAYNSKQGFVDDKVKSMCQDKYNNLWFATNSGIYFYDGIEFKQISTKDGLKTNTTYSIIISDNNLWVGTTLGIAKVDIDEFVNNNNVKIKYYGKNEGFLGVECNINSLCIDDQKNIWFGTVNGITEYLPSLDYTKKYTSIPKILSIKNNYSAIDWTNYSSGIDAITSLPKDASFPYDMNHLTFEFLTANLAIPQNTKYQYQLIGLDNKWSPKKETNEVTYHGLKSGKYIFQVKSCNSYGEWSEKHTSFAFEIQTPFWRTWWFYSIIVLIISILLYLYIRLRERTLKHQKLALERTVLHRTQEISQQKDEILLKNETLSEIQKEISDSISYARKIQEAVLPQKEFIDTLLNDYFVLFKPKDIVSGDFYFCAKVNEWIIITVADSTGHGVPGGFMSMLGVSFLNEIVNNSSVTKTNDVLNQLRQSIIVALRQKGDIGEQKDGMDMSIVAINTQTNKMMYSGANNPIYIISKIDEKNNAKIDKKLIDDKNTVFLSELKPDKMPVAIYLKMDSFTMQEIQLKKGDAVYLFSDGYADQFGGIKGKKLKYKPFRNLLLNNYSLPMASQKVKLDEYIENWKAHINTYDNKCFEQVDDITVFGFKL